MAGKPFPTPVKGETLVLGRRDAAAALATVDHAASELNAAMRAAFPPDFWAETAVEDYIEQFPNAWKTRDVPRREKTLRGFIARGYADTGITDADIADAVARAS